MRDLQFRLRTRRDRLLLERRRDRLLLERRRVLLLDRRLERLFLLGDALCGSKPPRILIGAALLEPATTWRRFLLVLLDRRLEHFRDTCRFAILY